MRERAVLVVLVALAIDASEYSTDIFLKLPGPPRQYSLSTRSTISDPMIESYEDVLVIGLSWGSHRLTSSRGHRSADLYRSST